MPSKIVELIDTILLFKPGVSGNPKGRPPGTKSLKTYAKEYLLSLSDEEKLEFMAGMDKRVYLF